MTDEKQGIIYKALSWVEKIGNKLGKTEYFV